MENQNQYIEILKQLVEETTDHKIVTSTDFVYLSGCIRGRLKRSLGVSTLKRIWGYIDGYKSIRPDTLDILAAYVGFPDWETFVSDYCEAGSPQSSHRVQPPTLQSADLAVGDCVEVCWNPGRRLVLRHLGEGTFLVETSENSKVHAGDRFSCDRFSLNRICYLENLVQGDQPPCSFVIGNKGGLTAINRL